MVLLHIILVLDGLLASSVSHADFSIRPKSFLIHRPERLKHVEDVSTKPEEFSDKGRPAPHVSRHEDF